MQGYGLKGIYSRASADSKVGLIMVKHKQNVRKPRAFMLLVHHTCWVNCEFLHRTKVSNVVRADKNSIKTIFYIRYFQFAPNILLINLFQFRLAGSSNPFKNTRVVYGHYYHRTLPVCWRRSIELFLER